MPADERLSTLVISKAHLVDIGHTLDRLMEDSEALCAMLLDISGMLLGWRGGVPAEKVEALGVLLANGYVAARQVASILGQPQFEAFLQQGKRQHILSEAIGEHWILVTIFEDRTSEGIVRLLSRRACRELTPMLDRIRAESAARRRAPAARPQLRPRVADALDELFRDAEP